MLYDGVNVTEVADDECISAESDVGRKDRGDQGRFGGDDDSSVYAGRIPGSPGV